MGRPRRATSRRPPQAGSYDRRACLNEGTSRPAELTASRRVTMPARAHFDGFVDVLSTKAKEAEVSGAGSTPPLGTGGPRPPEPNGWARSYPRGHEKRVGS